MKKTLVSTIALGVALSVSNAFGQTGLSGMAGMHGTYRVTPQGVILDPGSMSGMSGMAQESLSAREMAGMGMGGFMRDAYYGKQKVVYHVNYYGAKAQAGALRNIQNHINAVGAENLDLKVVLHGNGVSMVVDPEYLAETKMEEGNADENMQAKIAGLKQQGVDFQICANTLRGRNISRDALYDTANENIVPSGVAELSRLQQMGYTYVKP
jgi:intracellular sulfur oxidation DsrE/DsrF family protein